MIYEPQYYECEAEDHCYVQLPWDVKAFQYRIERDPKKYTNKTFKEATVIPLAVA